MDRDEVYAKVVAKIKCITAQAEFTIQENTEIYHDLKVSGDDLEEILRWAELYFGNAFLIEKFWRHAPGEAGEWRDELRVLFFKKSKFPSFTIRDFVDAIMEKSQPQLSKSVINF